MRRQPGRMRPSAFCVLALCLLSLRFAVSQSSSGSPNKWQSEKRAGLVWVDPAHDREHTDGYQFTETFDPQTFERVDYVKEPGQSEPTPFYKHNRAIVVALGHTRRVVLINDEYTTKLTRVVVAHLPDGKNVDASSGALAQYQEDIKPDPRLIVNPEGYALSHDDRLVLVRIKLTYLSVANPIRSG